MKKRWIFATVMVLFCLLFLTTAAEAAYQTAADLVDAWRQGYKNGCYPTYYCGDWYEDDTHTVLTVAVKEGPMGEAGKQEILDLIEDDASVIFVYRTYSFNELEAIQDQLSMYLGKVPGLASIDVDSYHNTVVVTFLQKYKDTPETKAAIEEFSAVYRGRIAIEYLAGEILPTYDSSADARDSASQLDPNNADIYFSLFFATVGALITAIALIFALQRHRRLALQTTVGETATAAPVPFTTAAVKAAVRNTAPPYPSTLDAKILTEIKK